jgi:XTP/dITP diphosphohydrolase
VLASGNPGKLKELEDLLADLDVELVSQEALAIAPIEETGTTFTDNALLKARHAARMSGLPALADDSGLEVEELGGAPGVRSARYAGPTADDAANNAELLRALAHVSPPRRARYQCVIAYVRAAADPDPLIGTGVWAGAIAESPRGSGGFGYDPLFLVDGDPLGRTAAMLTAAEKNRQSHRAQALEKFRRAFIGSRP